MSRLDPLLEEVLVAGACCFVLAVVIALLFRLFTSMSPWPTLIIGEIGGFGFGVALLAWSTPRRNS